MLQTLNPMKLTEILEILDISPDEAEPLIREAKIPPGREELTVPELVRIDTALERTCYKLAGRDWRRADGADRQQFGTGEIGDFDLFHRKTGERQSLNSFGQLLRWSEAQYGWRA